MHLSHPAVGAHKQAAGPSQPCTDHLRHAAACRRSRRRWRSRRRRRWWRRRWRRRRWRRRRPVHPRRQLGRVSGAKLEGSPERRRRSLAVLLEGDADRADRRVRPERDRVDGELAGQGVAATTVPRDVHARAVAVEGIPGGVEVRPGGKDVAGSRHEVGIPPVSVRTVDRRVPRASLVTLLCDICQSAPVVTSTDATAESTGIITTSAVSP